MVTQMLLAANIAGTWQIPTLTLSQIQLPPSMLEQLLDFSQVLIMSSHAWQTDSFSSATTTKAVPPPCTSTWDHADQVVHHAMQTICDTAQKHDSRASITRLNMHIIVVQHFRLTVRHTAGLKNTSEQLNEDHDALCDGAATRGSPGSFQKKDEAMHTGLCLVRTCSPHGVGEAAASLL